MYQQSMDQLSELKLKGFREAFILQSRNPDFGSMPFEERLAQNENSHLEQDL